MLPPIPPETLSANPLFSTLYTDLTTNHLNPDASTRPLPLPSHHSQPPTFSTLDQSLRTYRAELAKQHLLQNSLKHTTLRSRQLPEDLSEVLDLLTSPTSTESTSAGLPETLGVFHDNIQPIAHEISAFLDRSAKDLVSLLQSEQLGAGGGAAGVETAIAIDHLPANAARLRTQIFSNHQSLVAQRGRLGRLILEVVDGYAALSLRTLSHSASDGGACGALQKGTLAKATYLGLLAESMRGKVGVVRFDVLGEVYDEEAIGALDNYRVHLTDTNLRLVARKRVAEGELERYGAAGADMVGLVEKYAALLRGVESVGRDIRRLGGTV